jgi:hypothetical protein
LGREKVTTPLCPVKIPDPKNLRAEYNYFMSFNFGVLIHGKNNQKVPLTLC